MSFSVDFGNIRSDVAVVGYALPAFIVNRVGAKTDSSADADKNSSYSPVRAHIAPAPLPFKTRSAHTVTAVLLIDAKSLLLQPWQSCGITSQMRTSRAAALLYCAVLRTLCAVASNTDHARRLCRTFSVRESVGVL